MYSFFDKILTTEDLLNLKEKISKLQKEIFKKPSLLSEKASTIAEKELSEAILNAEKEKGMLDNPQKQFDF